MLPRITINGNVVADPDLKFTQGGKPLLKLRVASNENKKNAQGGWDDGPSCFLDVTVFDPLAEPVAEALRKGTPVVVTGRLQQREFTTAEGVKRSAYEVLADTVAVTIRPGARGAKPRADDPWGGSTGPGNQDNWSTEVPF